MPYIATHFFNFVLKLDFSGDSFVKNFFLALLAATPLLNTLTRVFCDPQLRQKLCRKKTKIRVRIEALICQPLVDDEVMLTDSLIEH